MRFKQLLVLSVILLVGCGGDDDPGSVASLHAATISGGTIAMDGTYVSNCHYSAGAGRYLLLYLNVSGSSISQSADAFATNDASCSGSIFGSESAQLEAAETTTTITTSGWVDSSGIAATAPLAGDGQMILSDNEPASVFNMTAKTTSLVYTAGQKFSNFIVVDDSGSKPILHFSHNYPTDLTVETDPVYTKQ